MRQFYTAPTLLRSLLQLGDAWPRQSDLSSLRLLASAGEPMNDHAWHWFHEVRRERVSPMERSISSSIWECPSVQMVLTRK